MILYKLDAFSLDLVISMRVSSSYFESLDAALFYLTRYCCSDLPWVISLYDGFRFVRFVARGRYA